MVSAILFAIDNVLIRSLKDLDTVALNTLDATGNFFFALPTNIIYRLSFNSVGWSLLVSTITGFQIVLLLGNGLLITLSMYLYIKAFQLDKAGRASSLWFLSIVVGYAFDILIFNYEMQSFEVIGSLVIVSSSTIVFLFKIYNYSAD
jgi:drug/metabolite transporter (DMT)-like permease